MTIHDLTHGRTGGGANNPPSDAGSQYAFARDGQIVLRRFGRTQEVDRWEAVSELLWLDGSPYPSSQERARQIRAALKETTQ